MALDSVLLTEIDDTAGENAEQDQTAHMCRLVFAVHALPRKS